MRDRITLPQLEALSLLCSGHVMVGTLGLHVSRANHRVFSINGEFMDQHTAVSLQKRGFVAVKAQSGARLEFEITEAGRVATRDHSLVSKW